MSFYRDSNGNVYGFLPNDVDVTEMTDAEVAAHLNPLPTPEQLVERAKAEAQAYLLSTDWVEPFLIKHELGIAILSEDSNKLVIARKRNEARELLQ